MGMKLELTVVVAVLRVVVSIIVISYIGLFIISHFDFILLALKQFFFIFHAFYILVWIPMLDETDNGVECSSTDLHVEKELNLLACKEEARKLDFNFIRHSNLTLDVTNGTEISHNMTEKNSMTETNNITETNMTENRITELCQIYRSCDETIPSIDGNTYQYSGKSYVYIKN